MSFPRATVRLQLHREFNFDDAAATVDYYAALGISHFYLSPIFKSREGSTHGYDVVDPTVINPELGGEAGFLRLVSCLREVGMGVVIDIVPNHMGVASAANPYWQDVLAKGAQSTYAHWFDIDWQSADPRLNGKVLLPVLGEPYGKVLVSGELALEVSADKSCLQLRCYDNRLPLSVDSQQNILAMEASLANTAIGPALATAAETQEGQAALQNLIDQYRHGQPGAVDVLHDVLQQQHYRLTWWRNAAEEINWRRFFEVSELAGVRVERDDVFEATHALVFDLYARGLIDGVRVDHVDGLADPQAYCRRLRERLTALQSSRSGELATTPAWIVVEKILSPGENLPVDWNVDGTTGYDFMDQVGAVLHHGAGETSIGNHWAILTGDALGLDAHVQQARKQLLSENFGGEFDALAMALFNYQASIAPGGQDFSLHAIKRVLGVFLASFRRYRSYVKTTGNDAVDRVNETVLREAFQSALPDCAAHDHELLAQLLIWLGLDSPSGTSFSETAESRGLRERAITRFQQLTPPLAAKSVEDTAFYRHGPLLSRNEVGSYPDMPSSGVEEFHQANLRRATAFPRSMLATATHDHKRGEDVRARLAVLTEMPSLWGESLETWTAAHAFLRPTIALPGGKQQTAPSPADEVMLYQTLIGTWPPGLKAADRAGMTAFASRISAWQQKALREAKVHSSWMLPGEAYEAACAEFITTLLCTDQGAMFRTQLAALVDAMTPAANCNSLAQTLLRLTVPGIPDLYQGAELGDFSLVDPDNRRPVDMPARRQALANRQGVTDLWQGSLEAGSKQHVIARALALRKTHPVLFAGGAYIPLEVTGNLRHHAIAFARMHGTVAAITTVLRRPYAMTGDSVLTDLQQTGVQLPTGLKEVAWTNVLSGGFLTAHGCRLSLAECWSHGPVALLSGEL